MDVQHVPSHVVLRCRRCNHGPVVAPLLGLPMRCDGCDQLDDPRQHVWFTPPLSRSMALRAASQWQKGLRRPLDAWPFEELRRLHRVAADNGWHVPDLNRHLLARMRNAN